MAGIRFERLGFEHLEPRQFMAAIAWDGGGGDTNWNNPLNWSGDILPTLNDDVTINDPSHPTIHITAGTSANANTLSSWDPLDISGGSLTLFGSWWQTAALSMSAGRVTGSTAGGMFFDGDFTWTGGTIDGGGGIDASRHVLIDGGVILGRSLMIYTSLEWRSGDILMHDAANPEPQFPLSFHIGPAGTFLIRSPGSMTSQTPAVLQNQGTIIRSGDSGTTTTIAVKLDHDSNGIYIPPFALPPATIDVRSGTLSFTGEIVQKQGTTLNGMSNWFVSGTTGRLLLSGPALTVAHGNFLLSGPGASFPALEQASSIDSLTLSGGRQWSFPNYNANLYSFLNVIIDNPGMTTIIPASTSPASLGSLRADNLVVRGGRLDILGGLIGHRVEVQANTVLVLSGISRLPYADVSGAGLIRVKGELDWPSGTIAGPGQLVITETGHFTTTGQYYELFDKTLTRRVINRGVMDLSEFQYNFQFSGEIANRGVLNLSIEGYLSTSAGIGPGYAPGYITNFGTINSYSNLTVRGASGAIRLNNQGTVHVASGLLILNGGAYGGGNWVIDAGAELAFGGFGSQLLNPTLSGAGRIRNASPAGWTNAQISGAGDFLITAPGSLALLGPNTNITRGTFTNNGKLFLGHQSNTAMNATVVNNAYMHTGTGTLNITGDLTFAPTSSLIVFSTSPTDAPRINASGHVDTSGAITMIYTWNSGFGANYDFLSTGSNSGEFTYINAYGNAYGTVPMFFYVGRYGRFMLGIF